MRSRAIPVEYVRFIIEVKSSFSASNTRHAINHLADLSLLLSGVDALEDRYKLHLPPSFGCCLLFAELRELRKNTLPGLSAMIQGSRIRGFYGGVILRSVGDAYPNTGLVQLMLSQNPINPFEGIDFVVGELEQVSNSEYIGTVLNWFEANFARFAFDLVAVLQDKYDPAKRYLAFMVLDNHHDQMTPATKRSLLPNAYPAFEVEFRPERPRRFN